MKLKLAAVAVALLVAGTGAAMALPGDAPDQVPADDHADDSNGTESTDESEGPPDDVPPAGDADENASDGQPGDLPEQVPDFVIDVHEAIGAHVDGTLSGVDLGERIASLAPGDGQSSDRAGNGPPANATGQPGTPAPVPL